MAMFDPATKEEIEKAKYALKEAINSVLYHEWKLAEAQVLRNHWSEQLELLELDKEEDA